MDSFIAFVRRVLSHLCFISRRIFSRSIRSALRVRFTINSISMLFLLDYHPDCTAGLPTASGEERIMRRGWKLLAFIVLSSPLFLLLDRPESHGDPAWPMRPSRC